MREGSPIPAEQTESPGIVLQKLSPRHKQALSLLAQGMKREQVAALVEYTPEYITWLCRQPLCREYVKGMNEYVDVRLAALYEQSVEAIAETLSIGSQEDKLKAARLQLEATGRVGRSREGGDPAPKDGHLEQLAQRLVGLLQTTKQRTYDGQTGQEIIDVPQAG